MKFLLSIFFLSIVLSAVSQVDVLNAIKQSHDCEDDLKKINYEITDLNDEYKKTVEDLKQGFYCSRCNRSKTEIQKSGEDFYNHINRVEGTIQTAPPEAFEKAKNEYFSKYNSFVKEYKSKQVDCERIRTDMEKKYQEAFKENNQQQQKAEADKYAALIEESRINSEKLQQQTNQLMESVNSMLSRLKEISNNKIKTLQDKSERFWKSNKEDLKALGVDYANKKLEPVTDEIENTKKDILDNLGVSNQLLSSGSTIKNIGNSATNLLNNELSQNDDGSGENVAKEEKNWRDFESNTMLEIAKTPFPVRAAFKVYENSADKIYKIKEKVLIVNRVGTSFIRIYFFNE